MGDILGSETKRIYFSADVEASGSNPRIFDMLALGICVVGRPELSFYDELRPVTREPSASAGAPRFDPAAMGVACLGLRLLKDKEGRFLQPEFDPKHERFNPELALQRICAAGAEAGAVMRRCDAWVRRTAGALTPVLVTDIQPFDGLFLWHYWSLLPGENPFGWKGVNLDMLYRGIRKDMGAQLRDLGLAADENELHNALHDALLHARLAERILDDVDPRWRVWSRQALQ